MEAAATEGIKLSAPRTAVYLTFVKTSPAYGNLSIKTWSIFVFNFLTARRMAITDASLIRLLSIVFGRQDATAKSTPPSFLSPQKNSYNFSLCPALNNLESRRSFNFSQFGSFKNTKAATETGPAKGPRPTSSIPATSLWPVCFLNLDSYLKSIMCIYYKAIKAVKRYKL